MKKLITLGIAVFALLAVTAFAGDYHTGATLNCSECHNMHYSQGHGYNPDGTGNYTGLSTGPHEFLLRADVNTLCLNCHDNQTFAPDVLATNGGTPMTTGRLAGALNSPATGVQGYFAADGHTLGSTDVAPGGTFRDSTGLECTDCHSPHGRTAGTPKQNIYRNLNLYVNGTPATAFMTYAIGTNDLTKDVFERSASKGGNHYDLTNVDYNEPDPTQSGYGKFCGQCHTNFHGTSTATNMNDGTAFVRHPTAGVDIADVSTFAAAPYRVKTMSQSGTWGTQGTPLGSITTTDNSPSCMSCHKSHGSINPFGLVYPDYVAAVGSTSAYSGSQPIGENGSTGGTYKGLCKQCHRIG